MIMSMPAPIHGQLQSHAAQAAFVVHRLSSASLSTRFTAHAPPEQHASERMQQSQAPASAQHLHVELIIIKPHDLLPHCSKARLPGTLDHEAPNDVMRDHSLHDVWGNHFDEGLIVYVADLCHYVALRIAQGAAAFGGVMWLVE